MDIVIIIATHKPYEMPSDGIYLPLHVGAEGKKTADGFALDLGYQKDNEGNHISDKNATFCELTGLYWAWKNLHCDYLGLAHYRRHFAIRKKGKNPFDSVLRESEARGLAEKYKVIVPKKQKYYIETLYSHYKHTHPVEPLDKAREIIEKRYPDFLPSYDTALKKRSGYMFNMFLMDKRLSDEYCDWLFSVLFELERYEEEWNLSAYSAYQSRVYGFLSELLFNVWLTQQVREGKLNKKDIKEIPCIYMEKINQGKKIIAFLKAKFFHKQYKGSF